jgi:ribosomal protein S18 acetylase RimI-like enzyme
MGRIEKVTANNRQAVLSYLKEKDLFLNLYAINRLSKNIENSSTFVLFDDAGDLIHGYLSVFEVPHTLDIVIRGEALHDVRDIFEFCFDTIIRGAIGTRTELFVSSDLGTTPIILAKFPNGDVKLQDVMLLRRGEERLHISHQVTLLSKESARDYSEFRSSNIDDRIVPANRKLLMENPAYGILNENGKVISTADVLIRLPEASIISGVRTDPSSRGQGFATSVVSSGIRDALRWSESVVLYVDKDNLKARRIYEQLGFHKIAESLGTSIDLS